MSRPQDAIDAAALQCALQPRLSRPLQVLHLAETASTNRVCQQRLEQDGGGERLWVICADRQTAGRGRRGRVWHSRRDDNLYCSIGLVRQLPAQILGLLPLLTGVVLAERLRALGFDRLGLKWPNDLLADGRKLGGVLIENRPLGGGRHALTIGFGINLRLDEQDRECIGQPAGCLSDLGVVPPRQQLLNELLERLLSELAGFGAGHSDALLRRFAALDVHAGRTVRLVDGERQWRGRCLGVDEQGRLRVEIDGRERCFSAAEISLRGADGGGHAAA